MTIVIKKVHLPVQPYPRGKIMPNLRAPRRKPVFGVSMGIREAARQVELFDRSPRSLFDKILRSQFGPA